MSERERMPPEPTDIKDMMKSLMKRTGSEGVQGHSLAVWYGNRLPRYLWTNQSWKKALSRRGFRWQDFLSALSEHTQDIIRWANDEIPWSQLVEAIEKEISNSSVAKKIEIRQKTATIDEY